MKIVVNNVEGKTSRKGSKQNRIYENVMPSETQNWFKSGDTSLWNVNGDWTVLGIMKGIGRCSYTKNFTVEL